MNIKTVGLLTVLALGTAGVHANNYNENYAYSKGKESCKVTKSDYKKTNYYGGYKKTKYYGGYKKTKYYGGYKHDKYYGYEKKRYSKKGCDRYWG